MYFCIKSKRLNLSKLYKEIFFIYLVCSITINAGYALKVGETTVAYNTFLSILLLILSFLLKGKFNKKIMMAGVVFWIVIAAGLLFFNLYPYKGGVVQNLEDWDYIISGSRYISYSAEKSSKLFNYLLGAIRVPIILAVLSKLITPSNVKLWMEKIYKIVPFIICFGIFEFVMKIILKINIYSIVSIFIGNVGEFSKLQGLTKEASQYAVVLFVLSAVVIINGIVDSKQKGKKYKSAYWQLGLIYLLMILTTSLTSYYLLLISILIVLVTVNVNKKVFIFVSALLLAVIVCMIGLPDYLTDRFGMISQVLNTLKSGNEFHSYLTSEGARLSSMYYAIKAALARPLTGIGLGGTDAHSTFFAMLANFGFIGTYTYFYMWKKFSIISNKDSKKVFYLIFASTILSGGIGHFMELYLPFVCMAYFALSAERGHEILISNQGVHNYD